jgi:hypothetical protein
MPDGYENSTEAANDHSRRELYFWLMLASSLPP